MQNYRKSGFFKPLFYLISVFIIIEVILWQFPSFLGFEVHQKYKRTSEKGIVKIYNGRGAQGELYKGQEIELAVFGSSISESISVSTKESWPEQLKAVLKSEYGVDVHIDNFAVGYNNYELMKLKLDELKEKGKKYDIILFQSIFQSKRKKQVEFHFTYAKRWLSISDNFPRIGDYFENWFNRWWEKDYAEKLISEESKNRYYKLKQATDIIIQKKKWNIGSFFNVEIRQNPLIKNRLRPHRYKLSSKTKKQTRKSFVNLISVAKKITDNIVWIPENIAYHEDMLDSYKNLYTTVQVIEKNLKKDSDIFFVDEQSLFNQFKKENDFVKSLASVNKISWIDVGEQIREKIKKQEGLYIDEYHLSPLGHKIAGTFIAENLFTLFFKNQNK